MKNTSKETSLFILLAYVVGVSIVMITFFVGKKYNIPFEKITGDPAYYFQSHPFTGIVSNIGALLWCATSTTCVFAGFHLKKFSDGKEASFLLLSGFFSFILLIDDFFMFHDYLFYSFNQFVLEPIIYGFYAILLIYFVYKYHDIILKSKYFLLATAVFFLGLSVFFDLVFPSEGLEYFFEDSLKFLGIVSWMLFFTVSSFRLVSEKAAIFSSKN